MGGACSLSLVTDSDKNVLSTVNNLPVITAWEEDNYKYLICSIDVFNSDIGLSGSFRPKFVKQYVQLEPLIKKAVQEFVAEVKEDKFPTKGHSF